MLTKIKVLQNGALQTLVFIFLKETKPFSVDRMLSWGSLLEFKLKFQRSFQEKLVFLAGPI